MPNLSRIRLSLFAALAAIVAVELGVGRTDLPGWIVPASGSGNLVYLEHRIIAPAEAPEVVVFGTSRARGAFLPTRMEHTLGLSRGAVLNLALGGANIFDAAVVYRRSREVLRRAHTMIVQVDPFQFNAGTKPDYRIRRYGTWEDRLSYRGSHRRLLQWEWVFRLHAALPELAYLPRHLVTEGGWYQTPGVDQFGRLGLVRIADDHPPTEFEDSRLGYWLDWQYASYWYSPGLEQMLLDLIATAHADGARVYVILMPTVDRYHELLLQYPGDPYGRFLERLEQVIGPVADGVGVWTTPAEAGLVPTDFRDWGHLNTGGAARWSAIFSRWLQSQDSARFSRSDVGS